MGPFSDVLQHSAILNLDRALVTLVRSLDQTVQVIVRRGGVLLGTASCAVDLLLVGHTTVLRIHTQAKCVLALWLNRVLAGTAACDISAQGRLADLLLEQLLILFVLLDVLLEELAQVGVELVVAFLTAVCLALLGR